MTEEQIQRIIKTAGELLHSITMDDVGMMVGDKWVGGNGGLISRDTIQKADSLRRALNTATGGRGT